jgi:hypothetical protein
MTILPNPADCKTFWLCSNGAAFLVTCPANEAFDRSYGSCTEAAEAECSAQEEEVKITNVKLLGKPLGLQFSFPQIDT